jgi:hypothetical protein
VTTSSRRTWSKVGLGAGLAVAVGAVLLGLTLGRSPSTATAPLVQPESDGFDRTLSEAKGLLARGDAEGAMAKAEQIPATSNLRNSADFKLIQSAWADDLFGRAAASADPTEKRSLLDKIARSVTLDAARRKRAANELDAMQKSAVSLADLPSEQTIVVEPNGSSETNSEVSATAEPKPTATVKKSAAYVPSKAPAATPDSAAAKGSATAKAPPKAPPGSATLVRQNPFDDP